MEHAESTHDTLRCIWMAAGLVTYKLCDREYDCERCPFDAALRGVPLDGSRTRPSSGPVGATKHAPRPIEFPDDRRYGVGHTWLGRGPSADPRTTRVGLDGFAWSLLDRPRALRVATTGRAVPCGAALFELDLDVGVLEVAAPCDGRVLGTNPLVAVEPAAAGEDPYGGGWLLEMALDEADPSGACLVDAAEARRRTGHDLRRLRRQVALAMLAVDRNGVGATLPDGGELVTDLRGLLGAPRYLELLHEFVH